MVIADRHVDCFLAVQFKNLVETEQGRGEAVCFTLEGEQSGALTIHGADKDRKFVEFLDKAFIALSRNSLAKQDHRCDGVCQYSSSLRELFKGNPCFMDCFLDEGVCIWQRQRRTSQPFFHDDCL